MVVKSFGDLDGKSRSAIRRAAASAHVEALANRVRELCSAFDALDADGLSDNAQKALWRAYDLMEEACSALDDAGRDGEDGQWLNSAEPKLETDGDMTRRSTIRKTDEERAGRRGGWLPAVPAPGATPLFLPQPTVATLPNPPLDDPEETGRGERLAHAAGGRAVHPPAPGATAQAITARPPAPRASQSRPSPQGGCTLPRVTLL